MSTNFSRIPLISNFVIICSEIPYLLHADKQTDRLGAANRHTSAKLCCERAKQFDSKLKHKAFNEDRNTLKMTLLLTLDAM